jgi:hypothetical protein
LTGLAPEIETDTINGTKVKLDDESRVKLSVLDDELIDLISLGKSITEEQED